MKTEYTFANNEDLLALLGDLCSRYEASGQQKVAASLQAAMYQFAGSPSEFLHEASVALKQAQTIEHDPKICSIILQAIKVIDEAFRAVGGA